MFRNEMSLFFYLKQKEEWNKTYECLFKAVVRGVRKVRMAIASKGNGKSGGARVITYNLYQEGDSIKNDLLAIYDKGAISNIADDFIQYLLDKRINI